MKNSNVFQWLLFSGVIAVWIAAGVGPLLYYKNLGESGTFGDTFGAVNSLFSGLAFAGLLYTINLQLREIRAQNIRSMEDRIRSVREMREQQLTAKLNATSSLLQSYASQLSIESGYRGQFAKLLFPRKIDHLQRELSLLFCEAELGFMHAGDHRLTTEVTLINFMRDCLDDLSYHLNFSLGDLDAKFFMDAVNYVQFDLFWIKRSYRGILADSLATAALFGQIEATLVLIASRLRLEESKWDIAAMKAEVDKLYLECANRFLDIRRDSAKPASQVAERAFDVSDPP